MTRAATLLALALTATGCMHNVKVGYLEAAEINVASDIQTVLVINRASARNPGEHVLAGMEGLATGETYRLDAESAALAIESLEAVLENAPRFEVVTFNVDGRSVDTSLWDREMTARQVRSLCRQTRCDAIIALETFDSDQFVALDHDAPTREERFENRDLDPPSYQAIQETDVTATFRMYDADTGEVLDQQRASFTTTASSGNEDTASDALHDLPHGDMVFEGAEVLGAEYASRISPHRVIASRNIFSGGSKEMRQAKRAAKRGNLERAEKIWQKVTNQSTDPKLKAKALHNLAVLAESQGDVERAIDLALAASELAGKRVTDRYVATLRGRAANDTVVARQLGEGEPVAMN